MQQYASSIGPLLEKTGSCASDRGCAKTLIPVAAMKPCGRSAGPDRGALYADQ